MEKRQNKSKKTNGSSSGQKVFGTNNLQISEDAASYFLGGIVEKGISEKPQSKPFSPITAPRPTVLPFPVARHRSHGPHWAPISSIGRNDEDNDDNKDDEEGNDFSEVTLMAAFANPVQRKDKKVLDFSQWRELITSDESSEGKRIKGNVSRLGKTVREMKHGKEIKTADRRKISHGPSLVDDDESISTELDRGMNLNSCVPLDKTKEVVTSGLGVEFVDSAVDTELDSSNRKPYSKDVKDESSGTMPISSSLGAGRMSHDDFSEAHFGKMKMDPALTGALKAKGEKSSAETTVLSSRSHNIGNKQVSMSLESEIDEENRARLQRMSPDEIAQAHAEIMEKMDPALLALLKKRSEEKLKRQKSSSSVMVTNVEPTTLDNIKSIQDAKGSPPVEVHISHSQGSKKNGVQQRAGPSGGNLWNAWSERVEAVRELRFSFDGDLISHDFSPKSESVDNYAEKKLSADNVGERDYLRTEGDPGAAGYTIKEAVALTRSAVPGQRSLGLYLLSSVLDKALHNICQNQVGCALRYDCKVEKSIDWEAVWAYVLGPEPELALSLRMSIDDNHNSVILACLKVVHSALSCDLNEKFFDISEKTAIFGKDIFTAPVFRSKPEIDVGFLQGGYWKYNTKPSNIFPSGEELMDDETEGKHTIQDDIVVAGQDFAAGLVRMGILIRLRYLLETEYTVAFEDYIISILIAIARHSPTCANAIMKCERLVPTIVHRFTLNNSSEVQPSKIKSVILLRVLARSDKKNCTEFVKNGIFQAMTWHLYQSFSSLEQWLKLGGENCKFSSSLMVEQLRFWKVCVNYGYCVSYFSDIFPALCLWLNPPLFDKLADKNVLSEFASISREAYLVLEALAARLPKFYSQGHSECDDGTMETWCWGHVHPILDTAVKWLPLLSDQRISNFFWMQKENTREFDFQHSCASLLWVYSAIMLLLTRVFERVTPDDSISLHGSGSHLPLLPKFVTKFGLEIIRDGFFSFLDAHDTEYGAHFAEGSSFIEALCHLRQQTEYERSLASVSCLLGLVQVIVSIDNLLKLAKSRIPSPASQGYSLSREEKILEHGILKGSLVELRCVLKIFMELVASEWKLVQSIEMFGRGGLAPGVGLGWGASGGGFWSTSVLLAQMDARFLIHLHEIFQMTSVMEIPSDEEISFSAQIINSILGICLSAGPRDKDILEKALDILFKVPVLKSLDLSIRCFLPFNKAKKLFLQEYTEVDYLRFGEILVSHFKNRWLRVKRKVKAIVENNRSSNKTFKKGSLSLDTIPEDSDPSITKSQDHCCTSLAVEWAHQTLPLPMHWFLSPISNTCYGEHAGLQNASKMQNCLQDPTALEIVNGGLFFLVGIEAMATILSPKISSPVQSVPLFWKLHSLSVTLLAGMGVLEEEKSRGVFEALQEHYGELLDEEWSRRSTELVLEQNVNLLPESGKNSSVELLRFQSEIHESYSTFIEVLVEQFAAVSYGDLTYGRQVGVYLHRSVEAPVRLAAWNSLSTARVLELLPPLEKCLAEAEGYLEPVENNDEILEAYVKSWTSGALDKAATRGSMAFTLVLHHLSSFIFLFHATDKLLLQNKLVKSLLRDYSRQQKHERMMFDLIRYSKPSPSQTLEQGGGSSLQQSTLSKRFEGLTKACEGNSSLLKEVEKLKAYVQSRLS